MMDALDSLTACRWCPRECGANRRADKENASVCGAGYLPKLARAALHHWEEPCISGSRGSGTVFFSHCNLKCVYCQNSAISRGIVGEEVTLDRLSDIFLELQALGAHNINLVSPTHYTPQIAVALLRAKQEGLSLPVIWNSGGYDSLSALCLLDGLVDIYLPDLKFSDDTLAWAVSGVRNYWRVATSAISEMAGQVGVGQFDDEGIALRGLIVRHLVLPGHFENTKEVLRWIRNSLPDGVCVSVMSQYFPATPEARAIPENLGRTLSRSEYEAVLGYMNSIGLEDGWVQELDSASDEYVPAFDLTGIQRTEPSDSLS